MENQEKRAPIDFDMFADQPESEVPDIFAGSPGNGPVIPIAQRRLQDNFDDPEGYYNFQVRRFSALIGTLVLAMKRIMSGTTFGEGWDF
jgi:hypothetical protein